ncbi:unnamed protein product [Didymodactylos carnosus]|uniref:Uncharacterized protein n=1 Tax=Didymodactylos carnosus TaxID=1234261 RepID=A0A8S2CQD0_9BILA|nr:unnamed protein product [Didymodactylos carnosus]CAF3558300.1 unnamed protein product [Didymodactylos carnosus]
MNLSDEELLFFGSDQCYFSYHPGVAQSCQIHSLNEVSPSDLDYARDELVSHAAASTSLYALCDDAEDKSDWQLLAIPNMPVTFIQIQRNIPFEQRNYDTTYLPVVLRKPLIKISQTSTLTGVISGVRSALIKSTTNTNNNPVWYRLKGCGNKTDGFLIQTLSADNTKKSTIRGCAFLHTTYRELYMTNYIGQLLLKYSIQCANSSIGWFEYEQDPTDKTPFINSPVQTEISILPTLQDSNLRLWSAIRRTCILMKTLGNKRLSDNVLNGLEHLFRYIIIPKTDQHPVVMANFDLLSLFPAQRLTQSEHDNTQQVPLPTWFTTLDTSLVPLADSLTNSQWLHHSSRISCELPENIDQRWSALWQTNVNIVNNSTTSLSKLLSLLYSRFGIECGYILGIMHLNRISWGTYSDALGIHCNAHTNNVVIKPETMMTDSAQFLVAPLDFDMSYTEASYWPQSLPQKEQQQQSFDEQLNLELSGFRMSLAGDFQSNSGVTKTVDMSDNQWESVRWLLRDTILSQFDVAYKTVKEQLHTNLSVQKTCLPPLSDNQFHVMYALIRLALILTLNETS